uniref:Uncharacterized protein n=1 Tax=Serinus canaria TaxID=9135 RepID=A0A8C9NX28_SERCA
MILGGIQRELKKGSGGLETGSGRAQEEHSLSQAGSSHSWTRSREYADISRRKQRELKEAQVGSRTGSKEEHRRNTA